MEKDNIQIKKCKRIDTRDTNNDANGWLLEIISDKEGFCESFNGQAYVVNVAVGKQKGFHIHTKAVYYAACVYGRVRSVFYNGPSTKTEIEMGDNDWKVVKIMPGTAHLLQNIGTEPAYVLAYRHPSWNPDDKEMITVPPEDIEKEELWKEIRLKVNSQNAQ